MRKAHEASSAFTIRSHTHLQEEIPVALATLRGGVDPVFDVQPVQEVRVGLGSCEERSEAAAHKDGLLALAEGTQEVKDMEQGLVLQGTQRRRGGELPIGRQTPWPHHPRVVLMLSHDENDFEMFRMSFSLLRCA